MAIALTAALAGVLALGAYAGWVVLLLATGLVQGLLVTGWHRALDVPGRAGGMAIAGAAAAATDALLVVRDDPRPLTPATGVLGLVMVAGLCHQLLRRHGRVRVTASLTATVTLAALAVLTAVYISAEETHGGAALVALMTLAAAAGRSVDLLPVPWWLRVLLGLGLGAGVGAAIGWATHLDVGSGALLGVGAACSAALAGAFLRRAAARDLFATAALPLVVAAPVTYVLGRIVVG